jgi:hypothetical protein
LKSHTSRLETRQGTAFITLTSDVEGEPFEVFLNLGKAGSETFAAAEALGRLISLALRLSSPLSRTKGLKKLPTSSAISGVVHFPTACHPSQMPYRKPSSMPWTINRKSRRT